MRHLERIPPMLAYIRKISRRARDRGASAVEYGLLVAAIAAVIVGVVFGLGNLIKTKFSDTTTCIQNHTTTDCPPPPAPANT
jgi:pilus assembly protein Flp/PilA